MLRTLIPPCACLAILAACATYEPDPIDAARELERARTVRHGALPLANLTALQARSVESRPEILRAHAAVERARGVAEVGRVLPNPTLDLIGAVLNGFGVGPASRFSVEAGLGWALPLGGRIGAEADLERARLSRELVAAAVVERKAYLRLRALHVRAALAARRVRAQREIAAVRERMVEQIDGLMRVGSATEVDRRLVEIGRQRQAAALADAELQLAEALGALAAHCGVETSDLGDYEGVAFRAPAALPSRPQLEAILTREHPDLERARADHELSEQRLRLQVALQYPEFGFGGGYLRETRIDFYRVPLAFELPIFDRNQREIARAAGEREEARVAWRANLHAQLGALEAAMVRLRPARQLRQRVATDLLSEANGAIELARSALRVGTTDLPRVLEVIRLRDQIRLEARRAEEQEMATWLALEAAVGVPLLEIEGEPTEAAEEMAR